MRKSFQTVSNYSMFIMNIIGYLNEDGGPLFIFDRNIHVDILAGTNVHITTTMAFHDILQKIKSFTITQTLVLVDKDGIQFRTPCDLTGLDVEDYIEYAPVTKTPYMKFFPYVIECELKENKRYEAYAQVVNVSVDYSVLNDFGEVCFESLYSFKNSIVFPEMLCKEEDCGKPVT